MATLSEDPDSWKARGVIKRDFQHIKAGPEVPKKNKKRNAKKWCKGKKGREHDVQRVLVKDFLDDFSCCRGWNHDYSQLVKKRLIYHLDSYHYKTKCVGCGMSPWNLPEKDRAKVDPALARRLELEQKWCQEGHLYDWVDHEPRWRWHRQGSQIKISQSQVCLMCGKKSGKWRYKID